MFKTSITQVVFSRISYHCISGLIPLLNKTLNIFANTVCHITINSYLDTVFPKN